MDKEQQVIGRVAATKLQGNNSREFYFWVEPETRINPLDLIMVKEASRSVYAQVLDITSYTDAESFLELFASTDFGNVELTSSVDRVAFSVAKAQVLGTSGEVRMPVQFNSPVYLADEGAIMELLRVGELEQRYRLPIGYIEQSNRVKVPVSMDVRWLTGPDGAHLNVSGKTRLAAKTSYVLFLVSSILQTQSDTAVIIFNVKGSDLLQIHKPNRLLASKGDPSMNEADIKRLRELKDAWECMDLEAGPFDEDRTFYFLASQRNDPNRINADLRNLPASNADITSQPDNYHVYRYTLPDVRGRLRYMLSAFNPNPVQEQFINALDTAAESPAFTSNTFKDLCTVLQRRVTSGQWFLNAHPDTIRVVQRFIENATSLGTSGVFDFERSTLAGARNMLPSQFILNQLQAEQVIVVDIALINPREQQWVFSDVLKAVERLMVEGRSAEGDSQPPPAPQKVVIFVDELNKYAPAGQSSPLINDVVDITARGGSLGVILFGAEQFASRIHPQVYGNCANKAFGLTDATETGTDPYRAFPREIKDRLSELQRGELVISFDFFGQPLRIKFPPPACRKQEDVS